MIKIKTTVNLCNIPYIFLDNSHMLLFNNKSKRNEYFNNHVLISIEMSFPYDDNLDRLNVPYNIDDLINVNYLHFNEKFYFVTDKVLVNDKITKLILVLDVLQTYLYDCTFYPSFVDRCHVNRVMSNGLPTCEVVSEGLAIGDYIQKEKEEICELTSSCVLATTTPLGYMEKNTDFNPVNEEGDN